MRFQNISLTVQYKINIVFSVWQFNLPIIDLKTEEAFWYHKIKDEMGHIKTKKQLCVAQIY